MEDGIKKTLKSLETRNLNPWFANNSREARDLILNLIEQDDIVGVGDSSSLRQIKVINKLKTRGTKVINPFDLEKPMAESGGYLAFLYRPLIEATVSDVFLTGINAVTQDGRLLSIDAAGNRTAGMFWGHPRVILVAGKNKIVRNLDEAVYRVKNVIAPEHISRRKDSKTPCRLTGICHDCVGKNRICAITTVIESSPLLTEINVVIVNQDLGLGWDESWPKKRINKIAANHEKFMWRFPDEVGKALDKKAFRKTVKSYLKSNLDSSAT